MFQYEVLEHNLSALNMVGHVAPLKAYLASLGATLMPQGSPSNLAVQTADARNAADMLPPLQSK